MSGTIIDKAREGEANIEEGPMTAGGGAGTENDENAKADNLLREFGQNVMEMRQRINQKEEELEQRPTIIPQFKQKTASVVRSASDRIRGCCQRLLKRRRSEPIDEDRMITVWYTLKKHDNTFTRFLDADRLSISFVTQLLRLSNKLWKLTFVEVFVTLVIFVIFFVLQKSLYGFKAQGLFYEMAGTSTQVSYVSFFLGFLVSAIYERYVAHFKDLPWPDTYSLMITTYVVGTGDRMRKIRRTLARYANLAIALTFRSVSPLMRKHFQTLEDFVSAGFLLSEHEVKMIEEAEHAAVDYRHIAPISWSENLLRKVKADGLFDDDEWGYHVLTKELNRIRGCLGTLRNYDSVPFPLSYIQIGFCATYSYIIMLAITRQFYASYDDKSHVNITFTQSDPNVRFNHFFPFITFIQFAVYIGWINLTKALLTPFGSLDCNINCVEICKRHLAVSFYIVDDLHSVYPRLQKDHFFDIPATDIDLGHEKATKVKESVMRTKLGDDVATTTAATAEEAIIPSATEIAQLFRSQSRSSDGSHIADAIAKSVSERSSTVRQQIIYPGLVRLEEPLDQIAIEKVDEEIEEEASPLTAAHSATTTQF